MISSSNSLSGYVSRAELLSKDSTTSIFQFDKAYWPQPAMSAIRPPADYSAQEFASYGHQHHGALPPDAAAASRAEDQGGMADYPGHSEQDRNGRPKRKRISPQQLDTLLSLFQQTDTPSYEQRERVAARLSMSNREVQVSSCTIMFFERDDSPPFCLTGLVPESACERAQRQAEAAAHGASGALREGRVSVTASRQNSNSTSRACLL